MNNKIVSVEFDKGKGTKIGKGTQEANVNGKKERKASDTIAQKPRYFLDRLGWLPL